jgi:hypothetical protein
VRAHATPRAHSCHARSLAALAFLPLHRCALVDRCS